jgi:uncharacterized protein YndB with AHSA1/START domain
VRYLAGRRQVTVKLSAKLAIPQSRERVFAFIADVSNMPKWVSGVTAARMTSQEMGVGATLVAEYRPNWRSDPIELEVVTYDPPTTYGTKSSKGPFQFDGCVTLEEGNGGTIVTNTIEAGPDSLSTKLATLVLGPFLRRSMQKRLLRELSALDDAVTA